MQRKRYPVPLSVSLQTTKEGKDWDDGGPFLDAYPRLGSGSHSEASLPYPGFLFPANRR